MNVLTRTKLTLHGTVFFLISDVEVLTFVQS